MNLDRLKQTLNKINEISDTDIGITRLAFTEADQQCRSYFLKLCREEGLNVHIDECGNIIARREGMDRNSPIVAMGSHLDTVIQGGKYDGTLGVVAALEVVRHLNEKGIKTHHPIELIVFASEESSRFGYSTLGSKAIAGVLDKTSISKLIDKENISIQEAFKFCNLNFEEIEKAASKETVFKSFIELHVEQGPNLEKKGKQVGIVTGIAAPTRFKICIKGIAAHSGSTSMEYRRDALMGASEIALSLEAATRNESHNGTVGTVGVLTVRPGAMNVIPGFVEMHIDIRGIDLLSKEKVINCMYECFEKIKKTRKLEVTCNIISHEDPVILDAGVISLLEKICSAEKISYEKMPSGAGHDAMNMARICPAGLIFVPSKDGLSHNPEEYTTWEEIATGVELLEKAILELAVPLEDKNITYDELHSTS